MTPPNLGHASPSTDTVAATHAAHGAQSHRPVSGRSAHRFYERQLTQWRHERAAGHAAWTRWKGGPSRALALLDVQTDPLRERSFAYPQLNHNELFHAANRKAPDFEGFSLGAARSSTNIQKGDAPSVATISHPGRSTP